MFLALEQLGGWEGGREDGGQRKSLHQIQKMLPAALTAFPETRSQGGVDVLVDKPPFVQAGRSAPAGQPNLPISKGKNNGKAQEGV